MQDKLVSNTNKNQGDSSCGFEILTFLPKKRFWSLEPQGHLSGCRLLRPKFPWVLAWVYPKTESLLRVTPWETYLAPTPHQSTVHFTRHISNMKYLNSAWKRWEEFPTPWAEKGVAFVGEEGYLIPEHLCPLKPGPWDPFSTGGRQSMDG